MKKLPPEGKRPQGRPRSIVARKNRNVIKNTIEDLFAVIAMRHNKKRPENFLSDVFDVEVYAVRQWTVRGIPKRLREEFADLAGMPHRELEAIHEGLV